MMNPVLRTDMNIREMINEFLKENRLQIAEGSYINEREREESYLTLYLGSYAANFLGLQERDHFLRLRKTGVKFIDCYRPQIIVDQAREFYHAFVLRIVPFTDTEGIKSVTRFCRALFPWMAKNLFCTEQEAKSIIDEMERFTKLVENGMRFARALQRAVFHSENIEHTPDMVQEIFIIRPADAPFIQLVASDGRVFSIDIPKQLHEGIREFDHWELQAEVRPTTQENEEGIVRAHPIRFGKLLPPLPDDLQRLRWYA